MNLISVILPVFNAEKYIKQAIDSILNQTYKDFEFLIYNDGSTDSTLDILNTYDDPRIKIKNYEKNIGLIELLNQAFLEAKGKYIARMDADDISIPSRLETQIRFLESHPDVGICGSFIQIIDSNEIILKPTLDKDLRWWIFKGSPFAHPSVMIRRDTVEQTKLKFNPDAYVVEDFEFWWKMAFYTKLANIDHVLLLYRIHEHQESSAKKEIQSINFRKSKSEFIHSLGINPDDYSSEFIEKILSRSLDSNPDNLIKSWKFFNSLLKEEKAIQFFGKASIEEQFNNQALYLIENLKHFNTSLFSIILTKHFFIFLKFSPASIFIFLVKTIFKWKTKIKD